MLAPEELSSETDAPSAMMDGALINGHVASIDLTPWSSLVHLKASIDWILGFKWRRSFRLSLKPRKIAWTSIEHSS